MRGIYVLKIKRKDFDPERDVLVSSFVDDNEALVFIQRFFGVYICSEAELHRIAEVDEKTLDIKVNRKNTLVCQFFKDNNKEESK